ncbi:hypothetical protein [Paenibacillus sp. D9]|uniref:hypothetical protein n=1 Tax=Paenibacillus sp. D9 TaxID=665792 RepID=UPI000AC425F2|nr:hypothetical protein [Paenibacillus sp. D9]
MIEMDETELLESDFSEDSLRAIGRLLSPWVAQRLLLPGPVLVQLPEEAGRRV